MLKSTGSQRVRHDLAAEQQHPVSVYYTYVIYMERGRGRFIIRNWLVQL